MPIYAYRCAVCGHEEDHLLKVSEAPLAKCPACGKKKYQKQLTAAGFQLKGSGWYASDFKGGKKPAEDKRLARDVEAGQVVARVRLRVPFLHRATERVGELAPAADLAQQKAERT